MKSEKAKQLLNNLLYRGGSEFNSEVEKLFKKKDFFTAITEGITKEEEKNLIKNLQQIAARMSVKVLVSLLKKYPDKNINQQLENIILQATHVLLALPTEEAEKKELINLLIESEVFFRIILTKELDGQTILHINEDILENILRGAEPGMIIKIFKACLDNIIRYDARNSYLKFSRLEYNIIIDLARQLFFKVAKMKDDTSLFKGLFEEIVKKSYIHQYYFGMFIKDQFKAINKDLERMSISHQNLELFKDNKNILAALYPLVEINKSAKKLYETIKHENENINYDRTICTIFEKQLAETILQGELLLKKMTDLIDLKSWPEFSNRYLRTDYYDNVEQFTRISCQIPLKKIKNIPDEKRYVATSTQIGIFSHKSVQNDCFKPEDECSLLDMKNVI